MQVHVSRRTVIGGAITAALIPVLDSPALASKGSKEHLGQLPPSEGMPRFGHTSTTLLSGRVLMAGGYAGPNDRLPTAAVEIFDPGSNEWYQAAPMLTPRARHAAVLLTDGRVVALGGILANPLASVEIYDPWADEWTYGDPLAMPMVDHAASVAGSQIILSGGTSRSSALVHPYPASNVRIAP